MGASQTLILHQPLPSLHCVGHSGGTEESPFLIGSVFHWLPNYNKQTSTSTDTQHRWEPISLRPSLLEEVLSAKHQPVCAGHTCCGSPFSPKRSIVALAACLHPLRSSWETTHSWAPVKSDCISRVRGVMGRCPDTSIFVKLPE